MLYLCHTVMLRYINYRALLKPSKAKRELTRQTGKDKYWNFNHTKWWYLRMSLVALCCFLWKSSTSLGTERSIPIPRRSPLLLSTCQNMGGGCENIFLPGQLGLTLIQGRGLLLSSMFVDQNLCMQVVTISNQTSHAVYKNYNKQDRNPMPWL